MIIWTGQNGCNFSLAVIGYQYPEKTQGHDANWLLLNITLENEKDSRSRTVADALAWELPKFAEWLQQIIDGTCGEPEFFFNDQHIRIKCDTESSGKALMSIYFTIWSDSDPDTISARVAPSPDDLKSAKEYILTQVKKFPPRGELGRRVAELDEKFRQTRIGRPPIVGKVRIYRIDLDFEGPEQDSSNESMFELWLEGDGFFDFDFPWRAVVELVRELQESTWESTTIEIQPFEHFEDFVDFELRLDDLVVAGYFEYSLCILYLRSESEELLKLIQSNCSGQEVEIEKIV